MTLYDQLSEIRLEKHKEYISKADKTKQTGYVESRDGDKKVETKNSVKRNNVIVCGDSLLFCA